MQHTLELRRSFAAGGRQLEKEAWKHVKSKYDVRPYCSCRALHGIASRHERSDVLSSSSSSDSTPHRSTMDKITSIASSTSSGNSDHYRLKKTTRRPAVVLSSRKQLGRTADPDREARQPVAEVEIPG
ncbi:hypothetical protein PF007_g14420 [Phytophthora fragariae]|uniref:Uncharacterized protein n=1 Tax=Phytophthora fragariae TaxID=53985 RepID=A0A6A3RV66_9STRA|nr:hypothetical protein PF003_g36181 [Phytophthora fragariae]KAE8973392.1 hypothetical protein PF011_g25273 [Phytophthora fragariae]KAE9103366.1 hypothetical protein PF007_g14420 [Phytophthora fragariae]